MRPIRGALIALAVLMAAPAVHAHPLAPALLDLEALPATGGPAAEVKYRATWRISALRIRSLGIAPRLPTACRAGAVQSTREPGGALVSRWIVSCPAGGLTGRHIVFTGLPGSGVDVILRIRPRRGRVIETLLSGTDDRYRVPVPGRRPAVMPMYLRLGVEHLLTGVDHMLFLLGLLLLVGRAPLPGAGPTALTRCGWAVDGAGYCCGR